MSDPSPIPTAAAHGRGPAGSAPPLELLDTTLRDGGQAAGITFSTNDKVAIAKALDRLGIPLIEAGCPGASAADADFFAIAPALPLRHARLAAFTFTCRPGTEAGDDPVCSAALASGVPVVIVCGKASAPHVAEVLRTTRDEALRIVRDTVARCRAAGRRVIFDAEHFFQGWKADPGFSLDVVVAAADAGADTVCLCDTDGGSFPDRIAAGTAAALSALAGRAAVGIHAHDDGDLAVANTLAAVAAGATHVQGTLAGFGERCGNARLSSVIPNLQLKLGRRCIPDEALPGLTPAVRRIAEIANVILPDGLPYVGARAFAHKAGTHADGVSKSAATFEHVSPESVGNQRRLLVSEEAGRSAIFEHMRRVDPSLRRDSPVVARVLAQVKSLEARGYQFDGAEGSFDLLVRKALGSYRPFFELDHYRVLSERPASDASAAAFLKVRVNGHEEIAAAEGRGPVNALDAGLRLALGRFYPELRDVRLRDYKVRVLDGSAATASKVRVLVESTDGHDVWTTVGVSEDILEASWIALVDSIEYRLIRS